MPAKSPAESPAQDVRTGTYTVGSVVRSVSSNWIGLGANVLIAFFMIPFVVHRLGDSAYGIWALVLQLTGYMGVVDVGLRSAVVRFVSRYAAERNRSALNQLMSTSLLLHGVFALLCLVGGGVLAFGVLPLLQIPPASLRESQIALLLAVATMASSFTLGLFQAVLAGLSRWDLRNAVEIATLLVRTALIVMFLLAGHGLVTLAIVHFLTTVAGHGVCAVLVRRLLPSLKLSQQWVSRGMFRQIFGHSSYSFLISIGNLVNYRVDTIVIAVFLPIQSVTAYVIGFKLVEYLRLLVNSAGMTVAPLASALEVDGRTEELTSLLLRGSKYILLIGYLAATAPLLLGRDFIRLWMGNEYVAASGTVLAILVLGQFVAVWQNVPEHILYGLSKHRVNVWCTGLEAGLNLGISLALVQRYGIYGVAVGTTVATVVVRGGVFPLLFLRILQVRWSAYLRYALMPVLLPTLSFGLGILVFRFFFAVDHLADLFLAGASGLVLYLPSLWIFGLDAREREMLRSLRPRIKKTVGVNLTSGKKVAPSD